MKTNFFITVLLLLLIFINITKAQVSGYMGKRLTAKFDTYTNIYIPFEGNTPDNPFSTRKSAGLEYIVGRNVSVGASYIFGEGYFSSMGELGRMVNNGISLGTSIYSDEALSPVGNYLRYEILYYKTDYRIWASEFYEVIPQATKTRKTGDISSFVMSFTWGQSTILFDRLNLSYGLQFGYRFGTIISGILDDDEYSFKDESIQDIRIRNFYHNLWGVHIGVGYLIF